MFHTKYALRALIGLIGCAIALLAVYLNEEGADTGFGVYLVIESALFLAGCLIEQRSFSEPSSPKKSVRS
jgi:hypothetical protein